MSLAFCYTVPSATIRASTDAYQETCSFQAATSTDFDSELRVQPANSFFPRVSGESFALGVSTRYDSPF